MNINVNNRKNGVERCPTGIPGFDEVAEGGFIRGSIVLLAGNPGTGKSTFSARFIHDGALRWNEPGVYVSFAEQRNRFYEFMSRFGMNFEELEKKGLISFIQVPTTISKKAIASLIDNIFRTVLKIKAKRLVIDSITPIAQVLGPLEARATLHNAIYNLATSFNVTIILVADLPIGMSRIGFGIEEFVADTVIVLHLNYFKPGAYRRYMNIVKMRGTALAEVSLEYSIVPGIGFVVHTPLSLSNTYIDRRLRIKTYIEELDRLLNGGLIKGTSSLIVGPSGSGKTLLMLAIAVQNAINNKKVLYVSLDEPISQLKETLRIINHNADRIDNLKIVYIDPYTVTPGRLRYILKTLAIEQGLGEDLVLIDGLTSLYRILGEVEFVRVIEELVLLFKNENIPIIMSFAKDYTESKTVLETIMDNVIVLRISHKDNEVVRELMVLKSRMNIVDSRWRKLVIKDRKIRIL